jgi:RecB family endonuclease NucS
MVAANSDKLLSALGLRQISSDELEILGEKALPQGHVDILLKQRVPLGSATKIPIEVKTNEAKEKDLYQLRGYMDELSSECPTGVLLAADFAKKVLAKAKGSGIQLIRYTLSVDLKKTPTFIEICQSLGLEPIPE